MSLRFFNEHSRKCVDAAAIRSAATERLSVNVLCPNEYPYHQQSHADVIFFPKNRSYVTQADLKL